MYASVVPCSVAQVVVLRIEVLRVESLPPFFRAVGIGLVAVFLGQPSVVFHSPFLPLEVEAPAWLVPCPCVVGMEGYSERQLGFPRGLCPSVKDVLVGPDGHGVPFLVLAVPEVEVIVMVAQGEEILCPTFLGVEAYQLLGVPVLGLEQRQDVLESHFRRMAVVLAVVVGLVVAFHVQFPCHPVA